MQVITFVIGRQLTSCVQKEIGLWSINKWAYAKWFLLNHSRFLIIKTNIYRNGRESKTDQHVLKWASLWENRLFAYSKTKTQISFAVTAKLISAFVFATRIVQSLYYLNPKFQASRHILWLYSPVCVRPGRKPRRSLFSERGSNENWRNMHMLTWWFLVFCRAKQISLHDKTV